MKNPTIVTFGDVVRNVDESIRDPQNSGLERYVGLEHIDPESLHIQRWGLIAEGTSFTRRFRKGQVLFGKRRAYQRKVAVAEFDGLCSSDILVFQPKDDRLLPELLPFICQSDGFFEHALDTSAGSLSPRTKFKELARYEFPLPPLDEQRRIAEILWAADEAFLKYSLVLCELDRVISVFRDDVFGDNAVRQFRLDELCDTVGIQIGPFGSQLHEADYLPEGIPVVMPVNIINGEIETDNIARISPQKAHELRRHKLKPGDVLLPRRGDLSKRAYVLQYQEGWICGTGSVRIRVKKGVPERAVFHSLNTKRVNNWLSGNAVGTTMPNLNSSIVSSIPIGLPKETKVEQAISSLDALCSIQTVIEGHLIKLTQIKNSYMNEIT